MFEWKECALVLYGKLLEFIDHIAASPAAAVEQQHVWQRSVFVVLHSRKQTQSSSTNCHRSFSCLLPVYHFVCFRARFLAFRRLNRNIDIFRCMEEGLAPTSALLYSTSASYACNMNALHAQSYSNGAVLRSIKSKDYC